MTPDLHQPETVSVRLDGKVIGDKFGLAEAYLSEPML